MSEGNASRFDLGFVGGGTTSGTIAQVEWDRLQAAFAGGDDAIIEVAEASATLWVRASQVAWARLHTRDARVGF
jgi:hypothetical protein